MVLVIAELVLKEGAEKKFLEAAQNCIEATRKEEGNITYKLLKNPSSNCEFTFVEEWKSKELLDEHMTSPHFVTFGTAINDLLNGELKINVYEANKLN